ncbi:mucin-2-like [Micropterus salmoides]|uniref:mucin-2-like n=1 Tax=Micropterus salmoides TaxID=27706 RepID=UPI0018EA3463|nr:mucin-2-like [Micropterus salmoides]
MAAVVVTSTKHGQQKISDQGVMDFSGMSLIKLKTEEMEAQVKVLQLESQLEQERVRLGELRKRHYELGDAADDAENGDDSFPPPPPPTLLDSTPEPQPLSQTNPFAPARTLPLSHTPTNTYSQAQSHPPPQTYTPPQSFTALQTYMSTQTYTPTTTYTPPQTYTPTTTYTPPQTYTPTTTYTPPQTYTPTTTFTPSLPYVPAQPYTPNVTQSYLNPQSYSPSQPSSHTSSLSGPQSPSLPQKTLQNNTETTKPASRRSNIFTKSGNLLKNAFKRGETGTGES